MFFGYFAISRPRLTLLSIAILLVGVASPSRADFIISVQSVTASAGSTGNALDVTLSNTGPSAATFGGFSFGLTPSAGISFTSVTTSITTAPYIFGNLGFFGSNITTASAPGVAIQASDLFSVIGSGTTLGAGAVVGLGHVFFNVAGNASGSISVALATTPATSLSNLLGVNVPVTRFDPGTILITPSAAVPEPASCLLLGMGVVGLLGVARQHCGNWSTRPLI